MIGAFTARELDSGWAKAQATLLKGRRSVQYISTADLAPPEKMLPDIAQRRPSRGGTSAEFVALVDFPLAGTTPAGNIRIDLAPMVLRADFLPALVISFCAFSKAGSMLVATPRKWRLSLNVSRSSDSLVLRG